MMTVSQAAADSVLPALPDAQPSGGESGVDKVLRAAFVLAFGVIIFVAGALLSAANIFPGPEIAAAYQGGWALYDKLSQASDPFASDLWKPERTPDKGTMVYDRDAVQPGVTLYASGHAAAAYLVDVDGRILHEWCRPYSSVWNDTAKVKRPQPDPYVYFRKVKMFANGDLLAIYEGVGDTPYGYGMVKLDRNSNVLWRFLDYTHHDFDVGPDGRIYVLTHDFSKAPTPDFGNLQNPRIEDSLVVLSPDGRELQRIPLLDPVAKSRYRHLLHTVSSYSVGDPLHTNDVDLISKAAARNFPYGKPGQILISFRELNAIGVLDPKLKRMVWMARGSWIGQHDPDILPNGNIILFDNYGQFEGPGGASRVMEFNPRNMSIAWQYAGDSGNRFDSSIRSEQQRLANGNTLIVESNGGRILEVTPAGRIVWRFINPVRGGAKGEKIAIVSSAERLPMADAGFVQLAHGGN
jgi:Arylsulfotransferase (ASST)